MSLYNDRVTCRQNADGTWTVRVTRRFYEGFLASRYRDETRTYRSDKQPDDATQAWNEAIRRERRKNPSQRDLAKRQALTQGLLSQPCEDCGAEPGASCDLSKAQTEALLLDRANHIIAHVTRAAAAIVAGAVQRHVVIAQLDGAPVPTALQAAHRAGSRRPGSWQRFLFGPGKPPGDA